jgi:hypothetical protein
VERNSSRLYPVVGFGISGVEFLGSYTRQLVSKYLVSWFFLSLFNNVPQQCML